MNKPGVIFDYHYSLFFFFFLYFFTFLFFKIVWLLIDIDSSFFTWRNILRTNVFILLNSLYEIDPLLLDPPPPLIVWINWNNAEMIVDANISLCVQLYKPIFVDVQFKNAIFTVFIFSWNLPHYSSFSFGFVSYLLAALWVGNLLLVFDLNELFCNTTRYCLLNVIYAQRSSINFKGVWIRLNELDYQNSSRISRRVSSCKFGTRLIDSP